MFISLDHPQHTGWPIIGGLWGFKSFPNRVLSRKLITMLKVKKIAKQYNRNLKSPKGDDQTFLATYFWPQAIKSAMLHASFYCDPVGRGVSIQPFRIKRPESYCFAMCSFCCDPIYNQTWPYECPEKCRPIDHRDWKYC